MSHSPQVPMVEKEEVWKPPIEWDIVVPGIIVGGVWGTIAVGVWLRGD